MLPLLTVVITAAIMLGLFHLAAQADYAGKHVLTRVICGVLLLAGIGGLTLAFYLMFIGY